MLCGKSFPEKLKLMAQISAAFLSIFIFHIGSTSIVMICLHWIGLILYVAVSISSIIASNNMFGNRREIIRKLMTSLTIAWITNTLALTDDLVGLGPLHLPFSLGLVRSSLLLPWQPTALLCHNICIARPWANFSPSHLEVETSIQGSRTEGRQDGYSLGSRKYMWLKINQTCNYNYHVIENFRNIFSLIFVCFLL